MAESKRKKGPEVVRRAEAGAREALDALVNQFSDPYSFLRELVQNSLDAGSTAIDVDLAFEPRGDDGGTISITVADNGDGMGERVIDNHLLTLFSSTKEEDLTKIGKFGIGFVSIFAMDPDLVVLETGHPGESWRIIFHGHGRFEKLCMDEPVEGTTITLYLHGTEADLATMRAKCRATVSYWCKHAEADIYVDGEPIREAFRLDHPLAVHYEEPGTELWLAPTIPGRDPVVGFYNRGLTLVEGTSVPGDPSDLRRLSMVVKSRYLEHTLTRDNVRMDEHFHTLLSVVRKKVLPRLKDAFVTHMKRAAAFRAGAEGADDPGAPSYEDCLVLFLLLPFDLGAAAKKEPLLACFGGRVESIDGLVGEHKKHKELLVASKPSPVTGAFVARDRVVLLQPGKEPDVTEVLLKTGIRSILDADAMYFTATTVEQSATDDELLAATSALLSKSKVKVEAVALGGLDYPSSSVKMAPYIRQERAFDLTRKGEDEATLFGGARTVVFNVSDPLVEAARGIAGVDVPLAALLLASLVGAIELDDPSSLVPLAAETVASAGRGGAA